MVFRWSAVFVVCLAALFLVPMDGAEAGKAKKVPMLDSGGLEQAKATLNLPKGSVSIKGALAPLPATIDTGTGTFDATIYMAYLVNSADRAVEIPLGPVYPSSKSKLKLKVAVKGDLSGLGFDQVVVVAFSKDGLNSFDVLTGTVVE